MSEKGIERRLGELLREKGLYICIAESCTGGLAADRITNVPGASKYFVGGVVSYSNQSKMKWLGVKESTLMQHGAVSKETVREMAQGILDALPGEFDQQKTIAVAISGIAGPDGGTKEKPVGTVWMCWQLGNTVDTCKFMFHGTRQEIKAQSAERALMGAAKIIEES